MFKLLGNKRLIILLFSLIFFIAVMGITLITVKKPAWPEKVFNDTVAWMQGLIYKPASSAAGFFEDVGNLTTIYEENEALKKTLAYYAMDVARLNTLEKENARLKEALDFTERQKALNDYTFRIAHVVAYSPDAYNNTIQIDLGSNDGIQEDWAVTTPDGLVGRVVRVYPFYSHVQLLTDLNNTAATSKAVAAMVQGEETSFGMIEGYDAEEEVFIMTKIKQEDPLKVGDVIVTSGEGLVFPSNIVIGTVISREVGEFGLTHTAKIKPAANFEHLREVFVVQTEVPPL